MPTGCTSPEYRSSSPKMEAKRGRPLARPTSTLTTTTSGLTPLTPTTSSTETTAASTSAGTAAKTGSNATARKSANFTPSKSTTLSLTASMAVFRTTALGAAPPPTATPPDGTRVDITRGLPLEVVTACRSKWIRATPMWSSPDRSLAITAAKTSMPMPTRASILNTPSAKRRCAGIGKRPSG